MELQTMLSHPTSLLSRSLLALAVVSVGLIAACSVNVKKNEDTGHDKKVDIETPLGGIHVSEGADVRDTGLPVYPGARPTKKDSSDDKKSANVNISGPGFALKVVAIQYESDDSPDKVISFYREQMKKFGNVLECHTEKHGADVPDVESKDKKGNDPVSCGSGNQGSTVELKVGKHNDQHIVSIEPDGKGAKLALVYVRTRGKEDTI
jgi:hypothetical protein